MKHLLLLALFIIPNSLNAQNWGIGTQWIYEQYDFFPDGIDQFIVFEIISDTIILNVDAFVLKETFITDSDTGFTDLYTNQYIIWKQDSMVYTLIPEENYWGLLYDFTAESGDTLDICFQQYAVKIFTQTIIDSIIDNIQYLFSVDHTNPYGFFSPTYLGIGNSYYFFPIFGAVDPPPGGRLLCFQNGVEYFPNQSTCDFLLNNPLYSIDSWSVYPNPTNRFLFIQGEKVDSWVIYSAVGQLVESGISNQVDLKQLNSGVYILLIRHQGSFGQYKFYKR